MQTKEKRLLLIVVILLIVFALSFTYMKKSNKKNNSNNDDNYVTIEALNKDYDIDGLKISNLDLYSEENESKFAALVTNNSDKDLNISSLEVIFYDKNENIMLSSILLYKTKLSKDSKQYVNVKSNIDLNKLSNIEFNVNYE